MLADLIEQCWPASGAGGELAVGCASSLESVWLSTTYQQSRQIIIIIIIIKADRAWLHQCNVLASVEFYKSAKADIIVLGFVEPARYNRQTKCYDQDDKLTLVWGTDDCLIRVGKVLIRIYNILANRYRVVFQLRGSCEAYSDSLGGSSVWFSYAIREVILTCARKATPHGKRQLKTVKQKN